MRVLLISPLPPPAGGIASWTKRYLASKTAKENEVDVVNIAVAGARAQNFTRKKVFFDEVKRLFSFIKELKKKLKNGSYDIVHMNSACSKTGLVRDVIAAHIIKKNKTKLLVHFRCDVTYMLRSKSSKWLFKKLVSLCDKVLTLNTISHKYILEVCEKESITVPNFVSDDYVDELTNKKEIKESAETFLFVGHVKETKGCDLICRIAEKFQDKTFVLVGTIGEKIASMINSDNVVLKGELPLAEVKKEYLSADVFILPTHTEGFPNVVTEAMSCGMPVITTPVGAIPDMIEDQGGIMIPVNDEEALIAAINKIESKELRESMSEFNRKKVRESYTIDKVMDRLFEIYNR
ncbi:MAG: glycosyltransferase family 4 protein [Clostridia bacterium]|nr:glycosyltransferase family 4 protein [Clostridia bacterium]